jgi:Glycosyl transferase family 2
VTIIHSSSIHSNSIHSSSIQLDSILVIIPVLNEAATIGRVVHTLQSLELRQIRVVDNGSNDGSAEIAFQSGAEVLFEPIPGYGSACWRGLQQMPESVQWILFCDGDGSDDLSVLPQWFGLKDAVWKETGAYDLILGNRAATAAGRAAMTSVQLFGNGLATTLIWWIWGHRYRDLGPLRLVRRSALEQIQMQDRGFGWTVEMQVRAVECGLRICEWPVGYRPRQGGQSKISGTIRGSLQAGVVILGTLGYLYGRCWIKRIQKRSAMRC